MLQKNILAVILARGGSKGIPKKNIYPIDGHPLISYTIFAGLNCNLINDLVVSTDSDEIASVARHYGAQVPFMRPSELATDTSPVIDTIRYTLLELEKQEDYHVDYVILLQAASPLIEDGQIDAMVKIAREKQADSVIALSEVDTINHPYNIREVLSDKTAKFWQEKLHYEYLTKPKEKFYHAANAWLSSYSTVVEGKRLEGVVNHPYIVPAVYSMDIDYKEDLALIEAWLLYNKNI